MGKLKGPVTSQEEVLLREGYFQAAPSLHVTHTAELFSLQDLKINLLSDKAQCCKFQTHGGRFRKSARKKLYYHKESSHLKFKEESSQSKRFLSGAGQIKISGWVT